MSHMTRKVGGRAIFKRCTHKKWHFRHHYIMHRGHWQVRYFLELCPVSILRVLREWEGSDTHKMRSRETSGYVSRLEASGNKEREPVGRVSGSMPCHYDVKQRWSRSYDKVRGKESNVPFVRPLMHLHVT